MQGGAGRSGADRDGGGPGIKSSTLAGLERRWLVAATTLHERQNGCV